MSCAYDKIYLGVAQQSLASMLDYAVYSLGYDPSDFFALFTSTRAARKFECGDPRILAGMSGIELAYLVLDEHDISYERVPQLPPGPRSREYWAGWALAYYQWYSDKPFAEIVARVSITDIIAMYNPYHEMDILQFVDHMEGSNC